jgi:pyridoxine 5-phosphate synthase
MKKPSHLRLGVNIDHVATLRNARGGEHPCPISAAKLAMQAGADGITAHLREDRRHMVDADMHLLKNDVNAPLNFEMAATAEMQEIALRIKPNAVCLVPEKRAERTTEGGLDVVGQQWALATYIAPFKKAGIRVSLFIDPVLEQLEASAAIGADIVELHTGKYAELFAAKRTAECVQELEQLRIAARAGHKLGLEMHAGHGLTTANVGAVAAIAELQELNIGHFLIGEAIFVGLESAVLKMRTAMDMARG